MKGTGNGEMILRHGVWQWMSCRSRRCHRCRRVSSSRQCVHWKVKWSEWRSFFSLFVGTTSDIIFSLFAVQHPSFGRILWKFSCAFFPCRFCFCNLYIVLPFVSFAADCRCAPNDRSRSWASARRAQSPEMHSCCWLKNTCYRRRRNYFTEKSFTLSAMAATEQWGANCAHTIAVWMVPYQFISTYYCFF